ncbi:Peptidoglycan/xylan/chitin deacetylase, PgdA/CDA1 family [Pseudarcicella hirudinis]|uniref:Peptidoglycan/xylan/chitin deacetylase, PgdA/CDA1 family n=1 Tax=Pseudarcicella hirudinis TaxID=1079859 RepID=A0A1I5TX25_9BACT|nr:polysaccharide deacetylase family protein [Pseudarcicella hirudinis]SFP87559.1 Peptidoglycan/xylan/chitin deacetylase, PgdA/CDA1 family [Pseudarcicella hirudinis]
MTMRLLFFLLTCIIWASDASAQANLYTNPVFIQQLYKDAEYLSLKQRVSQEFAHSVPGHWGEFVKGVDEDFITQNKVIAFTFDACGGKNGSAYDAELIDFLNNEKIPATLFVTGKWIDANYTTFLKLSQNPLFEIENHGFNHKPCSVDGESEYGIHGTKDVPDAFDEIEANAIKIQKITGKRPAFYRSSTAYTDEACAKIARQLGITIISFDVLSGDAVPNTPKAVIVESVLKNIKPGALVIMHFNRPLWNTYEAMQEIVPELRKRGYTFSQLQNYPLKGKN